MSDAVPGVPMDDERLLVGAVAVAGARAELALRRLLVGLLESSYAEMVAAGVPVGTLIANCQAIVDVHLSLDDAQKAEVKAMLGEINRLMARRNNLVHGLLTIDQSDAAAGASTFALLTSKHQKPSQRETLTVGEVRSVAERLAASAGNLLAWTFDALPAASQQHVLPPSKEN